MSNLKHISHRGGAAEFAENTLPAFKNAVRAGTEMLELDVHLTKDNHVVVLHDGDLFRVNGVNDKVKNLNYEDLPKKARDNLPVPFPQQPGQCINTENVDTKIPKLEELFQLFPGVPFNIDLKEESEILLEKTHDLIKKYERENLTIWGSFRDSTCQKCYKKNPDIPLLFSFKGVLKLLLFHYTGLLPFIPIKESFLEIPCFTERSANVLFPHTTPMRIKIGLWLLQNVLMSKRLFKHLNERGIRVFTWVQNHEYDFEFCLRHGANGIMTDSPTLLTKYFEDQKLKQK